MKPLKVLSARSPEILIGFGLAGMVVSTVLAVRATPKAMKLRKEELKRQEKELSTDISPITKKAHEIKAVLPAYVPTIVVMAASATCIIGGSATNYRRNAALATALHMSEAALVSYQDKVKEVVGEKKAEEVRQKVIVDDIRKKVLEPEKPIAKTDKVRCFEVFSGREFWSDEETLRRVALELNEELFEEDRVTLNEFYYKLGLRETYVGNFLHWDSSQKSIGKDRSIVIDLEFDAVLVDGLPYLAVGFKIPPTY